MNKNIFERISTIKTSIQTGYQQTLELTSYSTTQ